MGKRLPYTPNGKIRSALRKLFLRSREHSEAMKAARYTCARCGAKQSRAKGREVYVVVHHRSGVDWNGLFDDIRARLLNASDLEVLCVDCHDKEHDGEKSG